MTNLDNLPDKYKQFGYSLREPDDHILELLYKGAVIAFFGQAGATTENIIKAIEDFEIVKVEEVK